MKKAIHYILGGAWKFPVYMLIAFGTFGLTEITFIKTMAVIFGILGIASVIYNIAWEISSKRKTINKKR